MSADYDLPGSTTATVIQPSSSVAANTNSSVMDLALYDGAVSILLNAGAASAGTNPVLQAAIWDSADNSSFAAVSGAVFTNVTNANSGQEYSLDTRAARRYIKVVETVSGTNSPAFPVGIWVYGQLKYNPS